MRETLCAADRDVCCDQADRARFSAGQGICVHVSAGQSQIVQTLSGGVSEGQISGPRVSSSVLDLSP